MNDRTESPAPRYAALVAKVDAFHARVVEHRAEDLACRQGCNACCMVHLTVGAVEASAIEIALASLEQGVRERLFERWHRREQGLEPPESSTRCIMLEAVGGCAVYGARPLVCRTQGLAMRYPPRTFPEEAVMARDEDGSDIVWCPLNFKESPPGGRDVLEAGRVEEMLLLVNLEHVHGDREAAVQRVSLESLVARAART